MVLSFFTIFIAGRDNTTNRKFTGLEVQMSNYLQHKWAWWAVYLALASATILATHCTYGDTVAEYSAQLGLALTLLALASLFGIAGGVGYAGTYWKYLWITPDDHPYKVV